MNIKHFLVFIFFSVSSQAQEGFIRNFDFDFYTSLGFRVLEYQNHIYSLNRYQDLSVGGIFQSYGTNLAKHDLDGNLISKVTDITPNETYHIESSNAMYVHNDMIKILASRNGSIHIFDYDTVSDEMIFQDSIKSPIENKPLPCQDFLIYEDKYYIFGSYKPQGLAQYYLLILDNESYEIIDFPDPNMQNFASKIKLLPTGNLLLIGYTVKGGFPNFKLNLIEIDSEGNIISEFEESHAPYRGAVRDVVLNEDGSVVLSSLEFDNNDFSRPYIFKLDSDYNEEWVSRIGNQLWTPYDSDYKRILPSQKDDGYILGGDSWYYWAEEDSLINLANFAKLSADGDSIWYKTYSLIEGNITRHHIYDMEYTADGGYLAIGALSCGYFDSLGQSADPLAPDDFQCVQTLMIKIYEDGSFVRDTSSSVNVIYGDYYQNKVTIYPTPTNGYLYIEQKDLTNISYQIYDIQGSIYDSFQAPIPNHTYIVNLSNFNSGIYYLQIMDDHGNIAVREIIKK